METPGMDAMDAAAPRPMSLTAFGAAMLRVAHQLIDDEPKIVDDPILPRLFDAGAIARVRANPEGIQSPRATALRTHLVVRQRFAEDRLAEAYQRGVRQYVILGAGLDTFAYRQPEWAARELRIFEVDHPESQRAKRERLEAAGIAAPPNLTYVTLDFESDSIRDVLVANGFDASQPAFAACLGVLVYLTEAANDKVFQFVAALPASSEMALTFTEAREREEQQDSAAHEPTLAEKAAGVGEPFRTWMSADTLVSKLRALGFAQIDVLQPEETFARYLRDRRDGLRPPRRASIAAARI